MTNEQIAERFDVVSDFSHHHYLKAHEILILRSSHEDPDSAKRAAQLERRRERERGHSMTYRERKKRGYVRWSGYYRARQEQIGIRFVGEGTPRLRS